MSSNRQKLINLAQGKKAEFYCIEFSVDIRRNITIWRGAELIPRPCTTIGTFDWFSRVETPVGKYSHFFPEYNRLNEMEKEVADSLTREELLTAFFAFRKEHPRDGWGVFMLNLTLQSLSDKNEELVFDTYAGYEAGMSFDREDGEQVFEALQRRNRDYIKELWGVDLSGYPLDFDFFKEWERRCDALHRKNGWGKDLTPDEIWERKTP